jgi:hypothetical protein
MPTALRIGPYRFYFYSYDCGEPRHMHVDRENKSANSGLILLSHWLRITVTVAKNYAILSKL